MTTKHTPAPWRSHNEFGCFIVIAPSQDLEIAKVSLIGDGEDDFDEIEANAKLIAAAPDLLEALQNFVSHGSCFDEQDMQKSRAAIAKATQ